MSRRTLLSKSRGLLVVALGWFTNLHMHESTVALSVAGIGHGRAADLPPGFHDLYVGRSLVTLICHVFH